MSTEQIKTPIADAIASVKMNNAIENITLSARDRLAWLKSKKYNPKPDPLLASKVEPIVESKVEIQESVQLRRTNSFSF